LGDCLESGFFRCHRFRIAPGRRIFKVFAVWLSHIFKKITLCLAPGPVLAFGNKSFVSPPTRCFMSPALMIAGRAREKSYGRKPRLEQETRQVFPEKAFFTTKVRAALAMAKNTKVKKEVGLSSRGAEYL
jgi:hypothetical protein